MDTIGNTSEQKLGTTNQIKQAVILPLVERPLGIRIPAGLFVLSSALAIIADIIFFAKDYSFSSPEGIYPLTIFLLPYLGIFGIVFGIAIWRGKVWGWWLLVAMYIYNILESSRILFLFVSNGFSDEQIMLLITSISQILIGLAIISYLFN